MSLIHRSSTVSHSGGKKVFNLILILWLNCIKSCYPTSLVQFQYCHPLEHMSALFCEGHGCLIERNNDCNCVIPFSGYNSWYLSVTQTLNSLSMRLPVFLLSDTLSCASTSTSRWNPRWLHWTYLNKHSHHRPALLFPSLSLPSNLLRTSQWLSSTLLGWK